jgi:hypothetical protein
MRGSSQRTDDLLPSKSADPKPGFVLLRLSQLDLVDDVPKWQLSQRDLVDDLLQRLCQHMGLCTDRLGE